MGSEELRVAAVGDPRRDRVPSNLISLFVL